MKLIDKQEDVAEEKLSRNLINRILGCIVVNYDYFDWKFNLFNDTLTSASGKN